jgi:hypothetical protein
MLRLATVAVAAAVAAATPEVDPRERGVLRANPVTGLCDTVKQVGTAAEAGGGD